MAAAPYNKGDKVDANWQSLDDEANWVRSTVTSCQKFPNPSVWTVSGTPDEWPEPGASWGFPVDDTGDNNPRVRRVTA